MVTWTLPFCKCYRIRLMLITVERSLGQSFRTVVRAEFIDTTINYCRTGTLSYSEVFIIKKSSQQHLLHWRTVRHTFLFCKSFIQKKPDPIGTSVTRIIGSVTIPTFQVSTSRILSQLMILGLSVFPDEFKKRPRMPGGKCQAKTMTRTEVWWL